MNLRKPCLPPLWYPGDPDGIGNFLSDYCDGGGKARTLSAGTVIAAVAPHAGWYYSGAIAAQAVAALSGQVAAAGQGSEPDTVAVIGGHLPQGMPALFAMEDAADTPLGPMEIDGEIRDTLCTRLQETGILRPAPDRYQDNTVEVLLPMVRYFFPQAKLLWMRLPADICSFEVGKLLARTAASLGRKFLVLGSTDLTHYGHHYEFIPHGSGKAALDWVKNVNDRRFIDAAEAGDAAAVLARAGEERSACSAGAVLGVMGYAAELRGTQSGSSGKLLAYGTSADAGDGGVPDSFVGYGAFVWM
ncbi:MAG: AmmeMemoRadiSam system protein B [Spirochaetaceae bacterium]|jgi:AmmeMemoRadiSam system protein B|nr:AmmeMemoRadiSam system protein B [Spirochaetaceae bacterium]